jgi:hypothetical protein
MLRRTFTTSSGATHQSDQEKTARSNEGWLDFDLLAVGNVVGDAVGELGGKRAARAFNRLGVWIERDHGGRLGCDRQGQTAVAAAELQDPASLEGREPAQGG